MPGRGEGGGCKEGLNRKTFGCIYIIDCLFPSVAMNAKTSCSPMPLLRKRLEGHQETRKKGEAIF